MDGRGLRILGHTALRHTRLTIMSFFGSQARTSEPHFGAALKHLLLRCSSLRYDVESGFHADLRVAQLLPFALPIASQGSACKIVWDTHFSLSVPFLKLQSKLVENAGRADQSRSIKCRLLQRKPTVAVIDHARRVSAQEGRRNLPALFS